MNNFEYLRERLDQVQIEEAASPLAAVRRKAFQSFNRLGLPTVRNEEWKYTRISNLFSNGYRLSTGAPEISQQEIESLRLPGSSDANELFFVNGIFSAGLSTLHSRGLQVIPLETAAENEFSKIVERNFNHSSAYLPDGINALNTAFLQGGVFIAVQRRQRIEHPIYIYNIADTRQDAVLAQPRSLIFVDQQAEVKIIETYCTLGSSPSMTNQVMEIVVETDAFLSYCKIQNDNTNASQVSTTHIRQIGRSMVSAVTVSLNGAVVRNNLHAVMEAAHAEAHLYGLYFQRGESHVDNHTVVDNAAPDCQSNELYKGILDNQSTGVFNGKIFVRKDAQKTNAFQSNKNVLLSDSANINSKPQLEIFADDVKCSHGCTVGSLDEEGLFYLQSRGIPEKQATALLLQGFAMDVLEKIPHAPIRSYIEDIIVQRLTND